MRYQIALALIGFGPLGVGPAADPPDPLAARTAYWQKTLDRELFDFREDVGGVLTSLAQLRWDGQVHMIYDTKKRSQMTFRFERDGKDVLTLSGHTRSTFRAADDVLYFAHFGTHTCDCVVSAYDLTTGAKLWKTRLELVTPIAHSAYSNHVTLELSRSLDVEKKGEGVVRLTGRESHGDYAAVLDRSTGKVLASSVYRKGFGK